MNTLGKNKFEVGYFVPENKHAITTKQERQGGWVVHQLLKQFLTELDGGDLRRGVFVIGATNRPDQMDPAILRSGRFGKPILVSLPDEDERGLILKALARKKHLDPSVDLCEIAHRCENYTGADLAKLMKKAAMLAIDETFEELVSTGASSDAPPYIINKIHFEQARATIAPLSNEQIRWYQKFGKGKQLPSKSAVNVIEGLEASINEIRHTAD